MVERHILLLGAGGHGSVVLDTLLANSIKVHGIIDPGKKVGSALFGIPVLGGDEWLAQVEPGDFLLANGIGATPRSELRRQFFDVWKQRGFDFISLHHPSAVIGEETRLAEGTQIMAGSVVQCKVSLADNAIINTRASVDHDCQIGKHTFIGPGATLCGEVCVGDNAFIGAGAVVLPGISIGSNVIVGAGAIVTRDIKNNALVMGNPAMQIAQ